MGPKIRKSNQLTIRTIKYSNKIRNLSVGSCIFDSLPSKAKAVCTFLHPTKPLSFSLCVSSKAYPSLYLKHLPYLKGESSELSEITGKREGRDR